MVVRFIFVRHGETAWNKEGRYQGQSNIPLNPEGIRQAEFLAKRLSDRKIDEIYSSDLQRASQSAEIIAVTCGLKVRLAPDLREMSFGKWEGLTFRDIESGYGDLFRAWVEDPVNMRPPGGETLGELRRRVLRSVNSISERYLGTSHKIKYGIVYEKGKGRKGSGKPMSHDLPLILVVTHGGPIRVVISSILGLDPHSTQSAWNAWNFLLDPGGLSVVDFFEEGAVVRTLNDVTHLNISSEV